MHASCSGPTLSAFHLTFPVHALPQQAIIGTIGDVDAYQLPDAKGYAALSRHLLGVSDEERQARRDQILSASQKDFRWVACFGFCALMGQRMAAAGSGDGPCAAGP